MRSFLFLCLALIACTAAHAAPANDLVTNLPGFGAPPTDMYSGFLNCSAADREADVQLHYWYSQTDESLPVVLWLNGGPGSSSVLGLLQEWGPVIIDKSGNLTLNPYTWNNLVNVVLLESPAGVGYSYCATTETSGCKNTDDSTATTARVAMQKFFKKFPELAANDFYITGESYAGVYVPTLAKEILDNAPEINLVGVAVGDPCTDNEFQKDSMDMIWYGYKNGFVAEDVYDTLWNKCSARHPVDVSPPNVQTKHKKTKSNYANGFTMKSSTTACLVAYRKYLVSTSKGFSQEWLNDFVNNLSLFSPSAVVSFDDPGSLNYETAVWMQREDVKKALHVTESPNGAWPGPADNWSYTSQYDACNARPVYNESMLAFYADIAPRLSRTIVFNGDTDPCVSYEGTRDAMATVYPEIDGGAWRPWFYNMSAATYDFLSNKPLLFGPDLSLIDAGAQLGGLVVNYENNLSFLTVHGSGHMVPQFRPQASLRLLSNLITGTPFAELMPTDDELGAFTTAEFNDWIDKYIIAAKSQVAEVTLN